MTFNKIVGHDFKMNNKDVKSLIIGLKRVIVMDKDISISIVTYNSSDEISEVLDSIINSNQAERLDVYVVDNNSSDNTTSVVESHYPQINLMKLSKNVGFGKGHNKVIENSKSKYHIIINPDITFKSDVICEMTEFMDRNPEIVITTPKILNDDGTEQFLPKRNPKIRYFLGGRFEKYGGVFSKWRSEYTRSNENIQDVVEIDFCTGCFMFAKTEALKSVGGFDKRYFLHFEDADITREIKKIGRTVYNPQFKVNHS